MAQTIFNGDWYVNGNISSKTFSPPAGSIGNAGIEAAAGIEASKLDHQHQRVYAQNHGTANAAQRRVVHVVEGATAEIVGFECGNVVATTAGSSTTIQLKKNGSNILSTATVLDDTNTAYTMEAAAGFTSTSLVQGDVLEVDVTISGAAPGQGLFCHLVIREDAQ